MTASFVYKQKIHYKVLKSRLLFKKMTNFQDTICAYKRVTALFKKPCSPVFLNNYQQKKYADIVKETAYEKNQRKETLFELELL